MLITPVVLVSSAEYMEQISCWKHGKDDLDGIQNHYDDNEDQSATSLSEDERCLLFVAKFSVSYQNHNVNRALDMETRCEEINVFLASPDALEVIVVRHLLIVSTDLTDVTLVSDDTYKRLD